METPKADELVIRPRRGFVPLNVAELWGFREVFFFLTWRDLKVRYKQTLLGIAWAALQPIIMVLVFSFVFSRIGMKSEHMPYPVFLLLGLIPWNYFASVLGQSTVSLVAGSGLITKIYFPRMLLPLSLSLSALIDLVIAFAVLVVLILWYQLPIGPGILLVPFLILLTVMNAAGFGLWFSALNARFRDIQYAVHFVILIWMFASPIFYSASMIGGSFRWLLVLNPMAGVIEAFRPAVIGHAPIPWPELGISATMGVIVLVTGLYYFRRVERFLADII